MGNPSAPSLLQRGFWIPDTSFSNLQCGFVADCLFQKRFQSRHSSRSLGLHKAELEGFSQVGMIVWNLFERANIQVELGSGQFEWQWQQNPNTFVTGQISDGLIWSGSAKVVFFEIQDTLISADAHGGGWSWMTGPSSSAGIPTQGINHSEMRYWQLGAAISQRIGLFSPYIGIGANQTKLKISRLLTGTGWLRSRHKMGAFGGCSLSSGSYFFLNLEWRSWFEQAFSISGQLRF
jgi:hypothetical protein